MYSQCPDCQTRFRVTADALRAAHGTVRCGRCGSAFDALARLSDQLPPPGRTQPQAPVILAADLAAGADAGTGPEYHFSAADLERVFVEASDWRDTLAPPAVVHDIARESAGPDAEPPIVLVQEDAGVEDITLEGERIRIEPLPEEEAPARTPEIDLNSTDELEILRHVPDSAYPEDEEDAPVVAGAPEPTETTPVIAVRSPPAPEASAEAQAAPSSTEEPLPLSAQRWRRGVEDSVAEPAAEGSGWGALGWTLGSLALAAILAGQLIHHYRQDLVRHPKIGPSLRAAYQRFGIDLLPNWDLAAFEFRQWGNDAVAAAGGRMAVRASLTNRAAFAQPYPILRLELEDRFGATVATRDFEPAEYLKNPGQASRLIAPGASSEAELLLADPGTEAVGYRLDVCLRESASLLRCARGPG